VFAGRLYPTIRNPEFLLSLFSRVLEASLAGRLELHLFGDTDACASFFRPYDELLGSRIFLHGPVQREVAVAALRQADVLVNIGNGTRYQLPSKLIEYTAMGKRILNLVTSEDDSSLLFLSGYPAALSVEAAGELPPEELARVVSFLENPVSLDAHVVRRWTAPHRVEVIARAYEELLVPTSDVSQTP